MTVHALRSTAEALGAGRMVCYGNSAGGYAALRYGLDLQAARILAFGPITTSSDAVGEQLATRLGVTSGPDLRPLYEGAERRPRVRVVYGADHSRDAVQALHLAGIDDVILEAVPAWSGHDTFMNMIEQDRLPGLLTELAGIDEVTGD